MLEAAPPTGKGKRLPFQTVPATMHPIMRTTRFLPSALLLAAVLAGGCAQDIPPGHNASITGSVLDTQGEPLGEILIGALFSYRTAAAGAPTGLASPAASGVRLRPPYPNPSAGQVGGSVTIVVECDADTTGRLEIYAPVAGVPAVIATLKTGGFSAGIHTVTWDGVNRSLQIPVAYVPNGLYEVRMTVPENQPGGGSSLVLKQNLLINRPSGLIFSEAYNYQTAPDGYFLLEDLGIGEPFTLTSAAGATLGERVLSDAVTVYFRDPHLEYRDAQRSVTLGPRDQVTLDVVLESNIFSARTGRP